VHEDLVKGMDVLGFRGNLKVAPVVASESVSLAASVLLLWNKEEVSTLGAPWGNSCFHPSSASTPWVAGPLNIVESSVYYPHEVV